MRVRLRWYEVAAVITILLGAPAAGRAQTWREVRGDHFIVLSDAPERRVRSIAWQFEQMRSAMAEGLPWTTPTLDRPVIVIAARDENGMRALAPQFWEQRGGTRPTSVFVGGPDAYYIALRADVQVTAQLQNPHAAAYWAYSGLVLQRALGGRLPLWLTNGLAAVLSNTIVRNNEVEFGRPQPWMAERAKEGPRLPLPALFAVDHDSPSYRGGVDRERFDAQTWALVQFLIFGNKDNAAARFDQLIGQLAAGVPSEQAVTAVYGSVAALDEAYLLYVHQGVYSYSRLPTDTAIVEAQLPARVADPADHMASRAAFHVAMNRPAEARALIAAARQADPASPAADTVEAVLLDREQQPDEARKLFAKAAEAGSSSFWTYYRLATLQAAGRMTPDDQAAIEPWLERAAALNPRFAPAWAFLADIQGNGGQTDAAIESARRAVALDGGNVTHALRLVRLLAAASRSDEARAVAEQALPLADAQQRQLFEAILAGSAK